MSRRRALLMLLVLVLSVGAGAQRQNIRFKRLGTDDGLSQSNVTCILQDTHGFMWIGTRDGLNKYDGYRFTIYRNLAGDSTSLSNSYVTSLAEDREGRIWIGTWGGGVERFDPATHQFARFVLRDPDSSSVAADFINTVRIDSRGRVWVGTDGAGLVVIDPSTGKFRSSSKWMRAAALGDNDVSALYEDSHGSMWIGTFKGGLCRMTAGGAFHRFMHVAADRYSLAENSIYTIFEDSRHRLFVGTRGGGLDRFEQGTGIFVHYKHDPHQPNSLAHNHVPSLAEDGAGNLWVGTENGGLSVLDGVTDRFHTYAQDDFDNTSLANNSVNCIYRDRQGNMWLGTYSGGINVFMQDANVFTTFRHTSSRSSLGNNSVLFLLEDAAKTVWIGTDGGGLEAMDPVTGLITQYRHSATNSNTMCGDYVLSIEEDKDGRIWAGTWGDGLSVLDKNKKRFIHYRNRPGDSSSLGGDNIYSIARDNDNELFIGVYGNGLDRYEPATRTFHHFRHDPANPNSLCSDRIHTLMADHHGNLWIGTFDGGLDRFDKRSGVFKHYIHSGKVNSLSNNSVNCIYEDSLHRIWIGTGDGLNRLDPATGQFTVWRTTEGLPNNMVFGVVGDKAGMFWISTNRGLSRLDPKTGAFHNYTAAEGLQGNEFKPHSCLRSSSGRLYFGGIDGFNEFDPGGIHNRLVAAPLVITGFQLFNREVAVSTDSEPTPLKKDITEMNDLTLAWSNNVISFEFATLNYTPERNEYAYELEGFDTGWNNIGSRRMATYTHLDPGNYVLRIRGGSSNGRWGQNVRTLAIRITPPFWKTWWFRLLLLAMLIAAIGCIHAIRLHSLQKQKKKLEAQVSSLLDRAVAQGKHELAAEILHDIGNAIIGFSSYITRMKRLMEGDISKDMDRLGDFFRDNRHTLAGAIGEEKTSALLQFAEAATLSRKREREEMNKVIAEQYSSTMRVQEILHIQRQYISGEESQDRKPVQLQKLIADATAMLSATLQKHGIRMQILPVQESLVVRGDRTRLMQLFLNVLKNSIEALDIAEDRKAITIGVSRKDEYLVVEIRDSGVGFDEETAGKLFERGFSTKASGSGIGLYHCRTILDSHNGNLSLSSEGPGKGCTAVISFLAA